MERWVGKVAVVTGASSGIGAKMALRLADAGLIVVGLARRKELIDKIAKTVTGKGKIYSRYVDVSKPEQITAAFEWVEMEFGGVDILLNNAGHFPVGYITDIGDKPELKDDTIELTIDVNITAVVLCTRLAVKSMTKRGVAGHIVNTNSVFGLYVPALQISSAYPLTKYALTSFTQSLINELAKFNSKIKVTSLHPGAVNTDLLPEDLAVIPKAECDEVVDAVIYALSTPPNVNLFTIGVKAVGEGTL
ncbi:unnamed protein product, partial [Brenthis ino]